MNYQETEALKENLYREHYPVYAAKFERVGTDFRTGFAVAWQTAEKMGATLPEEFTNKLPELLESLLRLYRPKRKSGKVLKAIGLFLSKILPFIKFRK